MILKSLEVDRSEFETATGWQIKPEGACKGVRCVPLGGLAGGERFDIRPVAAKLGMPIVHEPAFGLWSLGPEAGGRALSSVEAPDLVLPDRSGNDYSLRSLRGRKVLLVAWASW
jgi:hypothetical protein